MLTEIKEEDLDSDMSIGYCGPYKKKTPTKPKAKNRKRRNSDDSDWEESKAPKISRKMEDRPYKAKTKKKHKKVSVTHLYPTYTSQLVVGLSLIHI